MRKRKTSIIDIILMFIAIAFLISFIQIAIVGIIIYGIIKLIIFIVKSCRNKPIENSEYSNTYSDDISDNEFTEWNDNYDFDTMDGHQFEYFCANIMKHNGYSNVSVTQGSGDNGVDIIAWKEEQKYAVQCKCYSSNIGNKAIQEVFTGKQMYNADIAVVMTNRYFTSSAINTAELTNVTLWNRDTLISMLHKAGFISNELSLPQPMQNDIKSIPDTISVPKEETKVVSQATITKGVKHMYDKEKGIFPSGTYEVGDDIEQGSYLLTSKKDDKGEITIYASYQDYKDDNMMTYNSFDNDFHLKLREDGLFVVLGNADMKKL